MTEDTLFSIHETVLSNMKRLSREQSILEELRMYELHDIALPMADLSIELLDEGLDIYEILSLLSASLTFEDYPLSDETTPEYRRFISRNHNNLYRADRASLTEQYLHRLMRQGHSLTERDFFPTSRAGQTFTYVRNSLSDEAYDVFSQDFSDPKVSYSSTFKECAQAVSSGKAAYCLLPLEDRGGVRLHTVSEIIFRNDFKINAVIPVFGPDGTADVKYAMVSKRFSIPKKKKDDDLYLEIRLGMSSDSLLPELFCAIDYFGMSVYRVNTLTFDTEGEREAYYSAVIKGGKDGFVPILTYMSLFVRDFVPVGIYKNLE